MLYIPISREQKNEINTTGQTPQSVLEMTGGCRVHTPEQRAQIAQGIRARDEETMERRNKDLQARLGK